MRQAIKPEPVYPIEQYFEDLRSLQDDVAELQEQQVSNSDIYMAWSLCFVVGVLIGVMIGAFLWMLAM